MCEGRLIVQQGSMEISNLPQTGGVFAPELETLLTKCKEKKKTVEDVFPDVRRKDLKRKFTGSISDSCKGTTYDRSDNPATAADVSSTGIDGIMFVSPRYRGTTPYTSLDNNSGVETPMVATRDVLDEGRLMIEEDWGSQFINGTVSVITAMLEIQVGGDCLISFPNARK